MKNRNYLPNDYLMIFENRIRSVGVWCDVSVSDKLRHKFICKVPSSYLAISLCGQKIVSMDRLHENVLSQKCLVCALFDTRTEADIKRLEEKLSSIIESHAETQPKDESE